jgi:hypothetical protein
MYETRLRDIEHEKQQMTSEVRESQRQQELFQVAMIIFTGTDNDETLPHFFLLLGIGSSVPARRGRTERSRKATSSNERRS